MATQTTPPRIRKSANPTRPGSFDVLHMRQQFRSDNALGIPVVPHAPLAYTPDHLTAYRSAASDMPPVTDNAAVHFFLDDYRFELVWSRPGATRRSLSRYRTLLTPDFSLYADWPLVAQQWNVYRSRWCGVLWASWGHQVIPTLSWSTPASYAFCFAGIPKHSLVAVSTLGVMRRKSDRALFGQGYREMIRQVQPSRVLCYGRIEQLGVLADLADTRCFRPDKHYPRKAE